MTSKKRVLIFKKQDTPIDQYNEELQKNNYVPQFIPVLSHKTDNIDKIKVILQQGPLPFHALILTSQRSVQALSEAYQQVQLTQAIQLAWNQLPIYIVGPHTAHLLYQLPLFNHQSEIPSHWTIAPRAAELVGPLVHDFLQTNITQQVLFLAGDKRHDLIPTQLTKAGIDYQEVQSYVTCVHPDLVDSLNRVLQEPVDWVVYFSPSGLKFILEQGLAPPSAHLAAIGPTTAEAILDQLHIHPHVTAEKPDALHLVKAMKQFDAYSV